MYVACEAFFLGFHRKGFLMLFWLINWRKSEMDFQQIRTSLVLFSFLIMTGYCAEEANQKLQKRLETLEAQNGEILQQIVRLAAMVRILLLIC